MYLDHKFASQLSAMTAKVDLQPLQGAKLALFNSNLASEIGFDTSLGKEISLVEALKDSSHQLNQGAVAQKYGGHQFGSWNPELGDGRGLLLGECKDDQGTFWDIHAKGAGKTPFSRFGDGRAVLRSTLREYLASEALFGLDIPTSRALALISSDEPVYREKQEKGAMLLRVCQSHIRFGHFEYFYHAGEHEKLSALFSYVFEHHFPFCNDQKNPHLALLQHIVKNTAEMIAKWQANGFCHGVMNTDNMSIHGITFDFGPYAFLDQYQSGYICNHSDHQGRYGFDQQPGVALWNLNALAHAFTPYVELDDIKGVLASYQPILMEEFAKLMRAKFGWQSQHEHDNNLLSEWLNLLEQDQRDYTLSFRSLSRVSRQGKHQEFINQFIDRGKAGAWLDKYLTRLNLETVSDTHRHEQMNQANPLYILRNYLAQFAIDRAEEGDFSYSEKLLKVLANPFTEQEGAAEFAKAPPDWGKGMEISCSS